MRRQATGFNITYNILLKFMKDPRVLTCKILLVDIIAGGQAARAGQAYRRNTNTCQTL